MRPCFVHFIRGASCVRIELAVDVPGFLGGARHLSLSPCNTGIMHVPCAYLGSPGVSREKIRRFKMKKRQNPRIQNRLNVTLDPCGHRQPHSFAQGRTCAKPGADAGSCARVTTKPDCMQAGQSCDDGTRKNKANAQDCTMHKRFESPFDRVVVSFSETLRVMAVVLQGESSKRLVTPRNTKDKKHLQSTQSAQPTNFTDQAPSTTERTARETHNTSQHSSHARISTTTTHHQHPHPTGSSPDFFSQRSPLQSPGEMQAGWLSRRAG